MNNNEVLKTDASAVVEDENNNRENFKIYCKELNERCKNAQQNEKEVVSEETAFVATIINRSLRPRSAGDFLLFFAALNVLNTYVKQPGNKKTYGYYFKRNASVLVNSLFNSNDSEIKLDLQESWGMPFLLADIYGIQCSFHGVTVRGPLLKLKEEHEAHGGNLFEFDEIRKQHCANTLFEGAISNPYLRNDRTLFDEDLTCEIERLLTLYKEGKITIGDIKTLHKNGTETTDKFLERKLK